MVYTAAPPDYCDNDVRAMVQQATCGVNFLEKSDAISLNRAATSDR
jgi:hypothetical protein